MHLPTALTLSTMRLFWRQWCRDCSRSALKEVSYRHPQYTQSHPYIPFYFEEIFALLLVPLIFWHIFITQETFPKMYHCSSITSRWVWLSHMTIDPTYSCLCLIELCAEAVSVWCLLLMLYSLLVHLPLSLIVGNIKCFYHHILITSLQSCPPPRGLSVISGLDYWNGLLDWNTGMTMRSKFNQKMAIQ